MKNLIFITVILLFATTNMFAQNETGYVKVNWDNSNVTGCCQDEHILVSYGVVRIPSYEMIANGYAVVDPTESNYTFSFEFTCSTENEAFRVFAEVVDGCQLPYEIKCGYQKDSGEDTNCSELTNGSFGTYTIVLE